MMPGAGLAGAARPAAGLMQPMVVMTPSGPVLMQQPAAQAQIPGVNPALTQAMLAQMFGQVCVCVCVCRWVGGWCMCVYCLRVVMGATQAGVGCRLGCGLACSMRGIASVGRAVRLTLLCPSLLPLLCRRGRG